MSVKVICIANQRGGVGKTTTAITLAHGLAQQGKRVLLIDLDPQGQAATALGRAPEPGAFYLLTMGLNEQETAFVRSWLRFSGREGLYLLAGDQQTVIAQTALDAQGKPISAIRHSISRFFKTNGPHYVILDTASNVDRAIWAADLVILPTPTDFYSADRLNQMLQTLSVLQEQKNWRGKLFGILPTFYDETNRESQAALEEMQRRFGSSLLSPIHHMALLRECAAQGQTIFESDPLCRPAKDYLALTRLTLSI